MDINANKGSCQKWSLHTWELSWHDLRCFQTLCKKQKTATVRLEQVSEKKVESLLQLLLQWNKRLPISNPKTWTGCHQHVFYSALTFKADTTGNQVQCTCWCMAESWDHKTLFPAFNSKEPCISLSMKVSHNNYIWKTKADVSQIKEG